MQEQEVIECIDRIIKSNDKIAFERLVNAYKNMVFNLCIKMTGSVENAEEISQDVFLKAYQCIRTFQGKSKFSTWLYQIAYFTTINFLRKNKIETRPLLPIDAINHSEQAISDLEDADRQKYIQEAFTYLNAEERAIISLYYMEDHSIEEISKITELSKSNVKIKLHRTRKKLYSVMHKLLKDELIVLVN